MASERAFRGGLAVFAIVAYLLLLGVSIWGGLDLGGTVSLTSDTWFGITMGRGAFTAVWAAAYITIMTMYQENGKWRTNEMGHAYWNFIVIEVVLNSMLVLMEIFRPVYPGALSIEILLGFLTTNALLSGYLFLWLVGVYVNIQFPKLLKQKRTRASKPKTKENLLSKNDAVEGEFFRENRNVVFQSGRLARRAQDPYGNGGRESEILNNILLPPPSG